MRPPRCCWQGSEILMQMSCCRSPRSPSPAPTALSARAFSWGKSHKTLTPSSLLLWSSQSPLALSPEHTLFYFIANALFASLKPPLSFHMVSRPFCTSKLTEDAVYCCCLGFLSTDSFSRLYFTQLLLHAAVNCAYLGLCPRPPGLCLLWPCFSSGSFVLHQCLCVTILCLLLLLQPFSGLLPSLEIFFIPFWLFFSFSCCSLSSLGQNFCKYFWSHFTFLVLIARLQPGLGQRQANCPVLFRSFL